MNIENIYLDEFFLACNNLLALNSEYKKRTNKNIEFNNRTTEFLNNISLVIKFNNITLYDLKILSSMGSIIDSVELSSNYLSSDDSIVSDYFKLVGSISYDISNKFTIYSNIPDNIKDDLDNIKPLSSIRYKALVEFSGTDLFYFTKDGYLLEDILNTYPNGIISDINILIDKMINNFFIKIRNKKINYVNAIGLVEDVIIEKSYFEYINRNRSTYEISSINTGINNISLFDNTSDNINNQLSELRSYKRLFTNDKYSRIYYPKIKLVCCDTYKEFMRLSSSYNLDGINVTYNEPIGVLIKEDYKYINNTEFMLQYITQCNRSIELWNECKEYISNKNHYDLPDIIINNQLIKFILEIDTKKIKKEYNDRVNPIILEKIDIVERILK